MDYALASECSSGVESGWTLYLEQSFINHQNNAFSSSHRSEGFYEKNRDKRAKDEEESDDEDDLSMVSDASSWPPHFPHHHETYFHEQDNNFYSESKAVKNVAKSGATVVTKKQKVVKEIQHSEDEQNLPSFLHDTASSHVFDFSMNEVDATNLQNSTESMLDYSQGFSATYIQRRSPFQEHFGFLQQSLSEKELHGNKWYGGKGIGMR